MNENKFTPPVEAQARPRWPRMLVHALIAVLLAVVSMVALARPAAADICASAPDPVAPKSGLPGMLTTVPNDIPDQKRNPFTDTSVPIGEVYGYNWSWSNYDLGCGNDMLRDPAAVTNTKSGNVILSVVGASLASLASLEQMAKSSSLDWLTDVIGGIAEKLREPVLALWLPLALLGVGLIVGFRAKRSNYADTMRTLLIIGGAAAMAVFALVFPATASKTADQVVVSVADATGAQFGNSASDSIARESAYRTWLTGNFGNPDSDLAKELGPQLMDATHYSWSEMKQINTDPDAQKQIDKAKAAKFKAVADELDERSSSGYEMFTGRGERTGPAMFGVVVVLAMSLFVAIAMLMVLIARVMMQGLALAAPLAAVLGVLPTHNSVLSRLWDLFTAALVAVAKFVIAGGVMAMVLGAIQTNDSLGAGAKLFWVVVATVVGIVLTQPVRSFKTIMPGLDPNRSYLRTVATGLASYLGAHIGTEQAHRDDDTTKPPRTDRSQATPPPSQEASTSLEPLPTPNWNPSQTTHTVHVGEPIRDTTPGPQQQPDRSWPGVVASPPRAELAAAPQRLETSQQTSRSVTAQTRAALPAAATGTDDTSDSNRDASASPTEQTASDERFVRPRPTSPAESGSEVIYPTGVLVADDESSLYRRSKPDAADTTDTYVPMADPELAEDGSEHAMVTYHSRSGVTHAAT